MYILFNSHVKPSGIHWEGKIKVNVYMYALCDLIYFPKCKSQYVHTPWIWLMEPTCVYIYSLATGFLENCGYSFCCSGYLNHRNTTLKCKWSLPALDAVLINKAYVLWYLLMSGSDCTLSPSPLYVGCGLMLAT